MLDPIVNFFTRIFQWIGRGIGLVIGIILWPFLWVGRWYTQRGWILKAVLGLALLVLDRPLRLFLLADPGLDGISIPTIMPTPTTSTNRNGASLPGEHRSPPRGAGRRHDRARPAAARPSPTSPPI